MTVVRHGSAYVLAKAWNFLLFKVHRVWVASKADGIAEGSCTLWGVDPFWKFRKEAPNADSSH